MPDDGVGSTTVTVVEAPERPAGTTETKALLPTAGSGGSSPSARSTHQQGNVDPLLIEEAGRARGWSLMIGALAAGAMGFTLFLPGTAVMMAVFRASLVVLIAGAIWTLTRTSPPERYTPAVFRIFGWTAATASFGATYYVGVASPVPLIVTLGITFFGLGIDRWHAIAVPLYASAGYVVLSGGIWLGILPDAGLVKMLDVAPSARLLFITFVPAIYLITLWMSRLSRRTMQDAIDRSNRALVVARQRAAQLAEAQQNLEDVLRAGAGGDGKYTGATAGDYTLAEVIGRGAMGEVYAGTSTTVDRVAIKVLRTDRLGAANLERFFREGELGVKLQSPNIVRVYDVGQLSDGMPFIAMEHLEGEDLATKLRRHSRLSMTAAIDLVAQVAKGLDTAHAAGIVHRDLKPHNLFEVKAPRALGIWKILDFGVSKLLDSTGTLTQAGVVGTPGYMAPEQARGQDVDLRADVFGLGAVAYRVLTGSPPFRGADTPAILFEVVYRQVSQPSQLVTDLTVDIDRVLAIAMAKRPNDRFESASALAAALSDAAKGTLSPSLAARADAAIAAHPWGTKLAS